MKTAILILVAFAAVASAQTTYSVELGAGAYLSTTPHSAGVATLLVGPAESRVNSYTTYEVRPLSLKTTPTTVAREGVQYIVYTSGKFDLAVLGQLGVANGAVTSLAGAAGGKLIYNPGWRTIPGFYGALTVQGVGQSAALGGWNPSAMLTAGYTFQGIGIGTLSARRKLAAKPGIR